MLYHVALLIIPPGGRPCDKKAPTEVGASVLL
jgi:hypothetical protein